ncbi:hypothetical protein [Embleya sp. AB8]|uniref:hypothetical protein n=1 Tax=Embleya sp. AB8 TaxID=3156304 RepID=UPI003C72796D
MTTPGGCPVAARQADRDAVSVTVVVRAADGWVTVDEHVRVELPSPRAGLADVLVTSADGPAAGDRDRELAAAHPGALVTLIVCGPDRALVRIGAAPPGTARRTGADPSWPVYASILHTLTVLGAHAN